MRAFLPVSGSEQVTDLLQHHLLVTCSWIRRAPVRVLQYSGNARLVQLVAMLSHKMVPKYMKDLEMKSDNGSYHRDEGKCLASGEKALVNYQRVLDNPPPSSKRGYSTVLLYLLKRNELLPEEKEKCEIDEKIPDTDTVEARAKNRKKETTL